MMKHISILVPKGAVALSCVEGSFICFNKANDVLKSLGREPMFNVQLVGITKEAAVYDKFFAVSPDTTINSVKQTNLIIIPAVNGEVDQVLDDNKALLQFIKKKYDAGAEIASLCVGAFILAETGLLDGKQCSTHWHAADEFASRYPQVEMVSEKIITDDHGLYSSGGAISFYNLLLYLISKYAGRDVAIACAKYFEIEIDRFSQSQFLIFQGQKEHADEPIRKAQTYIENNVSNKITIDQLADMFAVGRRSLERRFKKATQNTVSEYIQRVRMEAAKKSFESSAKNISEIMYDVGYSDTKAFRTVFKKTTGLSPIQYRSKYNSKALA